MSKYGLGRGLSSLFSTFDQPEEKTDKQTDALSKARNLIEETNKKSTLQDINETVENKNYIQDKQKLQQKLDKVGKEYIPSSNETVVQMEINKIEPNTNQPRKSFDREALLELSESIKQHGVIQPIIIVQKGEKFSIVAGERRYRASKMAGLKKIPAIIKDYTSKDIKEIALIENIQREDLNPVETAYALKQLIEDYNLTQDEVSEKIGKNRTVVTNYLRILKLQPEVLGMVEKGKLSLAHAKALVSITNREEQIKLARKASDDKLSSREIEAMVQALLNPEKIKKNKENVGIEIKSLINKMQYTFGTKVNVIGTNNRGRIYIDYFNKDDLDRIASLIEKLNK